MKSIIGIINFLSILCFLTWNPGLSQFSKEVQKSFDISKDGRIDIDTYKGSITIQTWDKPQITIDVLVEADGRSRYDREMVEETEIRMHSSSDRVEIRTDYGRTEHRGFTFFGLFGEESGNLPFVHYKINMPATARLKIKDYKSNTKITNLASALRLDTYKGSVVAEGIAGPVDLETYKGDIKINFAGYSDECSFETYKGRIELILPRDAGFKLDADLGKRSDFTCGFDLNTKRRLRDDDYIRATVNGGGPELSIRSKKGEIHLDEK